MRGHCGVILQSVSGHVGVIRGPHGQSLGGHCGVTFMQFSLFFNIVVGPWGNHFGVTLGYFGLPIVLTG